MAPVDAKWLEFGITGGLLITIVVFILSYWIPRLIKAYREGLQSVAEQLKEVNSGLQAFRNEVRDQFDDVSEEVSEGFERCTTKCGHAREGMENRLEKQTDALLSKLDKLL